MQRNFQRRNRISQRRKCEKLLAFEDGSRLRVHLHELAVERGVVLFQRQELRVRASFDDASSPHAMVTMSATGTNDWSAIGIPLTPIDDFGHEDTYSLASVTVEQNSTQDAATLAVVPVSWEIRCDLCHTTPGISVATDILQKHDNLHGCKQNAHPKSGWALRKFIKGV